MCARKSSLCLPGISLLCIALLHAPAALAQDKVRLKDVNDRLVRVERVLDQSLLELLQQVESLKREIRVLRGELENQTYELGNLRKRNRDLYLDTDQRITDLEKQAEEESLLEEGADTTGSIDGLGADGQTPVFVATNSSEPDAGAALASTTGSAAGQGTSQAASVSGIDPAEEKAAYAKAYDMLTTGNKAEAVASFKSFLTRFPDGNYADNAWYWQGEARYAQRDFDEAINLFETVVKSFPGSPKVPDARLKIAYALFEQERYLESRNQLNAVVTDYPGRAAGTLAAKRLAEMDSKGL